MWARGARSLTRNEQGFSRSHHDPFPPLPPLFSASRGFLPVPSMKVGIRVCCRELAYLHKFSVERKICVWRCIYIYIYTRVPRRLSEGGKRVRVNRLFAYGVYTNFMRVKEVLSSLFLTANSFAHAYIFVISSLEQRRSSKFIFIELIRFKLSLYYFIF